MTNQRNDDPRTTAEEDAFVARLKAEFTPARMTPARRAAFDASVAERTQGRSPGPRGLPLLVGAIAAAALAWIVAPADPVPMTPSEVFPGLALAEMREAQQWEDDLFDAMPLGEFDAAAESEGLPEEFAAIADAFLDG